MKLTVINTVWGEHEAIDIKETPMWIDASLIECVSTEKIDLYDESNNELHKKKTLMCGVVRTKSGGTWTVKETPDSEPLKGWIDAVMN